MKHQLLAAAALLLLVCLASCGEQHTPGRETSRTDAPVTEPSAKTEPPTTEPSVTKSPVVDPADEFSYQYNEELGGYMLSSVICRSASGEVAVPASYEGKPVVGILSGVFSGKDIRSVTLPGTLARLESGTFAGCQNLTEITFEGTLKAWKAVPNSQSGFSWGKGSGVTVVHCSDGDWKMAW